MKVEPCSLDISLTFKIKLKTGFFKTQPYDLTLGKGEIILTPLEDNDGSCLVIKGEDLQAIWINIRNVSAELEIMTVTNSYIASFTDHTCLEEVSIVLAKEFGGKVTLQDEF
ncbi:hypothetical protein [Desulfosporosinus meridiei]|uniref:Uncharacterized protein n=1 Tax=Desulfosporosinus meridiei (strain ATCC BAA-275 / DSM 13257 / KCTC 12902 / NCIMB 13706 / S10) TaxID=768704 RepID=J7IXC2_DESMD|nr:hypothetical protein [Desulfosporosinus meridiei]AFQ43778.1 hypothetical protein Desmer_1813 [Desulfosporosinus meridiei DSM 13257]